MSNIRTWRIRPWNLGTVAVSARGGFYRLMPGGMKRRPEPLRATAVLRQQADTERKEAQFRPDPTAGALGESWKTNEKAAGQQNPAETHMRACELRIFNPLQPRVLKGISWFSNTAPRYGFVPGFRQD
ncbi:hypothetical protein CLAIMM_14177 isoform 2 [Cladophialophora immunda]|nr:hypothetical protein CLAIMM_14177 isoform 2 [Cladophialophora immunda]